LTSRSPRGRWIPYAHSENRCGLARWAGLDPEVSSQTSHACQEDRPLCPTCRHLTSVGSAVAATFGPLDSNGCCPGASRAGANVRTEPDFWPRWRALLLGARSGSSSAKVCVRARNTTGPHDHSTTAALSRCRVIDMPSAGANENPLGGQFVKSDWPCALGGTRTPTFRSVDCDTPARYLLTFALIC